MRQVERDGDARDAIGAEPLGGQPVVRAEGDTPGGQFLMQLTDSGLQGRALDTQAQVAERDIEQRFIAQVRPLGSGGRAGVNRGDGRGV